MLLNYYKIPSFLSSLLVLFVACCLILPCGADAASDFKIGACITLSGKLAFYGDSVQQGLTLAVEEINAAGGIDGRKLALIIEDNAGEAKSAVSAVKKLFDVDKADVLFTGFTHISQAVKQEAARAGKVMIYHASLGSIAEESELFFRDWSDTRTQAQAMYEVLQARKYKSVGIIQENSDVCSAAMTRVKALMAQSGISIAREEIYDPGEQDFKPLLLRIKTGKPQALAVCAWRDEATLMPQLNQLGMLSIPEVHHFAPFLPVSDTPEMRALFEKSGAVSVWLGFAEGSLTPKQQDFFDAVKRRFGRIPRIEAAMAYDNVYVLAEAIRKCPAGINDRPESKCIARRLLETDYEGAAGKLSFDNQGRSNRPDLLIKVVNGRWQAE